MWFLGVCYNLCRPVVFIVLSGALVDAGQGSWVRKVVEGNRNGERSCHTFNHKNSLYLSYILDFFVRFLLKTEVWQLHFGEGGMVWWWGLVYTSKSIPVTVWITVVYNRWISVLSFKIYRWRNSTSIFVIQFHVSLPLTVRMFLLVFHVFFGVILAFFFFGPLYLRNLFC